LITGTTAERVVDVDGCVVAVKDFVNRAQREERQYALGGSMIPGADCETVKPASWVDVELSDGALEVDARPDAVADVGDGERLGPLPVRSHVGALGGERLPLSCFHFFFRVPDMVWTIKFAETLWSGSRKR
jgi:hypothetical protein